MRSFFQPRTREQVARTTTPGRANSQQAADIGHPTSRAELEEGVTVSELSELEARALCAREGIAFFWPMREAARRA